MPHLFPLASVVRRLVILCAAAGLAFSAASRAQDVPVPKQTFTTAQLYQPLRTFTTDEIGILPTFAGVHRGYLVISGGRNTGDPLGYGKLTTWRLSQAAAPNTVNPSLVGQLLEVLHGVVREKIKRLPSRIIELNAFPRHATLLRSRHPGAKLAAKPVGYHT